MRNNYVNILLLYHNKLKLSLNWASTEIELLKALKKNIEEIDSKYDGVIEVCKSN